LIVPDQEIRSLELHFKLLTRVSGSQPHLWHISGAYVCNRRIALSHWARA
jgi:hypothetical protein